MMKLMGAITAVTVAAILIYLWLTEPDVTIHFFIAVGLGVGASMLLMGALMGLVFMSNGTGHDEWCAIRGMVATSRRALADRRG